MTSNVALFRSLCKREGIPMPTTEHAFAAPQRRFRFDLAWIDEKVALEIEGGVWTNGRHTRGSGFSRDIEKYNLAGLLGWRVFRVVPSKLCDLQTVTMIKQALDPQFVLSPTQE